MAIIAPTFDFMKVSPGDDAHLYDFLSFGGGINPNYGTMFSVQTTGLVAKVNTGMAIIKGRMVKNTDIHEVNIPANSSGFIAITIDLTKTNTFEGTPGDDNYKPVNNQVRIERVASLVQQDILNGGSIYMFPICSYTSDGSTVTTGPRLYDSGSRKGSSVLLYDGITNFGNKVTLGNHAEIGQFAYLEVGVRILGNNTTIIMTRMKDNTGGFYPQSASGVNLYNDTTTKNWEIGEATITYSSGGVTMTWAKYITSSGTLKVNGEVGGSFAINTVIGHH